MSIKPCLHPQNTTAAPASSEPGQYRQSNAATDPSHWPPGASAETKTTPTTASIASSDTPHVRPSPAYPAASQSIPAGCQARCDASQPRQSGRDIPAASQNPVWGRRDDGTHTPDGHRSPERPSLHRYRPPAIADTATGPWGIFQPKSN